MADKLMDTEPGGENTQYESINEFTKAPKKESGQLGGMQPSQILPILYRSTLCPPSQYPTDTSTPAATEDKNEANSVGITPADKIRYGQALQEGGMGGKTEGGLESNTSTSDGLGREEEGEQSGNGGARAAQGYGEGSGVGG
ncbi:hypothetical protein BU16DRAFT_456633 [Lophium mytilinum]|uniref:Uncharacterized protein n=1 Tax=Lophium mytilinum TaxID=390894 RepID=A0A6A6R0T2_9PEZI|nr:hypothetical protein BU16DRAFT_456633 [Lophium mytilinum]